MRILNSFGSFGARRLAFRVLIAMVLLAVSSADAFASHFRYATISVQPVLNGAGQPTGQVRFQIKSAWRRSFFGTPVIGNIISPESFFFGDGGAVTLNLTVTSFNAAEDWVVGEATIFHQYPAGNASSSWVAFGNGNARISNLNNGANADWYYDTLVRPYTTNQTPTSALPPIVTVPRSTAAQFFVPASDVDRDVLTFRMSTNAGSGTNPVPPGFSINSSTGLVTWNNNTLNTTNFWFAQMIIEDHDGTGAVKSRIPVDVLLKIVTVTSQPPTCLIDGLSTPKTFSVQAGNAVSFTVTGGDPDGAVPVTLNASGMPGGATLSPAMPFSGTAPISSTFNWTPGAADAGARTISFSTTDNTGLVTLNSVNIFVENNLPPTITGPATLSTPYSPQTAISVQVADPNGDALTVTWELDNVVVRTDNVPASQNPTTLAYTGYGAVGPHTVKATVKDTKNATASLTTAVTVIKADQTITFGALAGKTFGDSDFSVSATASSGLAVTFSIASGPCQLTGSSVHITGAGDCTVRASQAGDGNYNAAAPVDRSFTIAKADQTITFSALGGKTFGDADFPVSATASSGLAVTFSIASGPCQVTGNSVHISGAGSCTVRASQAGDDNYNAATPVDRSFTIGKADQSITFNALGGKTFGDADFPVSATASSGLAVTFSIASGSCQVTGDSVHVTGAGSCTVRASQAGNDDYNAAAPVDQSFTIAKADQTITFAALAGKTFGDADFAVTATAGSGLPVTFTIVSGPCQLIGNSVHITGAGDCTVRASQAGDGNYNAAPPVDQSFAIARADQAITFGALAGKTFGDADFAVTATASSMLAVTFSIASGPCQVTGSSVHITGGGNCTVRASQAGDGNYNAAPPVDQSFTIAKADQTIAFAALAGKIFGDADFTVAASASSGLAVTFSIASGPCQVSGDSVHLTGAGNCTVTASQAGNDDYNAAPPVDQSFAIAKADQTITFNALAGKTFGDADFAATATASSGLAVTFSIVSGPCQVAGSSVHIDGAGSCTVRASQAGDGNYNAATPVDRSFAIAKANQTISITIAAPSSAVYNTTFSTAATGGLSGNPVTIGASGICGVASGGSGSAVVHMDSGTGTCSLTYNQAGNSNYNPASQVSSTTAALKASQSISITANAPAAAAYGGSFTVAATGGSSGKPIAYTTPPSDGCTDLGPTFTVTSGVNSCQVLYNQAGDTNYSAAPQVIQNVSVVGFGFDGFFAPIDMSTPTATIWNKATAGQAIPAKWRLTLNGVPVSSLSSFVGLYSYDVSCSTGAGDIEDAIEEYAPGASGLTYDGDGRFHYNWKTPLQYKNTCRVMYVSFSDGSISKLASFKFK